MPDPAGMKMLEGFPYTISTFGFSGMGRTWNALLPGIIKSSYMGLNRKTCFVSGNIKTYYPGIFEFLYQLNSFQTLLFSIVPECTQNNAGFNTCFQNTLLYRFIYNFYHLSGR